MRQAWSQVGPRLAVASSAKINLPRPAARRAGCFDLSWSRNAATSPPGDEDRSGNDVICLSFHPSHHLEGVCKPCFELESLDAPGAVPVHPVQNRVLKPCSNGGKK